MQIRLPEVRRAVVSWTFMAEPHAQESTRTPIEYIMIFAESIEQGMDRQRVPGPMRAAFTTASCHLQLIGCIGIRVGHGVKYIEAVPATEGAVIMRWHVGRREDWSWIQIPHSERRMSTQYLFGVSWPNTPFMQFAL
eukprot:5347595-Pyramimonas_sp.AAC.1